MPNPAANLSIGTTSISLNRNLRFSQFQPPQVTSLSSSPTNNGHSSHSPCCMTRPLRRLCISLSSVTSHGSSIHLDSRLPLIRTHTKAPAPPSAVAAATFQTLHLPKERHLPCDLLHMPRTFNAGRLLLFPSTNQTKPWQLPTDNDNDNDTLREVPHPSNEGLALQARLWGS